MNTDVLLLDTSIPGAFYTHIPPQLFWGLIYGSVRKISTYAQKPNVRMHMYMELCKILQKAIVSLTSIRACLLH